MNWKDLLGLGGVGAALYWLLKRQDSLQSDLNHLRLQLEGQYQGLLAAQETHYFQLEALFSLFSQIQPTAPLPPLRKWSIAPDFANVLVGQIQAQQPTFIVELGGGVSTLLSAYCLRKLGKGRVLAIDHEASFAQKTSGYIEQHKLGDTAQVLHAPLADVYLEESCWFWYSTAELRKLRDIDLLVVDGPAQYSNPYPMVRYPALPVLFAGLKKGAHILLDDAQREDERAIVQAWIEQYPITRIQDYETLKGAVLLRKVDDQATPA